MDNLIYRREIPVMIGVFINPGRRPDQPEPDQHEWGDRTTNRPTEYNSLDDRYARVIVDELIAGAEQAILDRQGPGPARHRRRQFRRHRGLHRRLGTAQRVSQSPQHCRQLYQHSRWQCYPDIIRKSDRKPIRVFLQDGRNDKPRRRPRRL